MVVRRTVQVTGSALLVFRLLIGLGKMQPALADDHSKTATHPDCMGNRDPKGCTEVIMEIKAEFECFNQAFDPPNLDEIAKFYHPQVVHYISAINFWFRGREEFRNNFLAPFVGSVAKAKLDFSPYRFQVIDRDLVIPYGALPGVILLKSGATVIQTPLAQTVTRVRSPERDRGRPFVVLADHE